MPINVSIARPKLNTTNNLTVDLIAENPVTVDNKIRLKVLVSNIEPNTTEFSCTYSLGSPTITLTNNTGQPIENYIRVGDIIEGDATAFPGSAVYVTAISNVGTAITLTASANALAASGGGGTLLTFDLGIVDGTLYILELDHTASASNLVIKPAIYTFDGKKVQDANRDGDDDATVADAISKVTLSNQQINLDTYLNNARLERTNA